ncbi:hypothetical protein GCM10010210_18440 [Pseudonocardia hydrocarbonoxydans]|uniref:Uncharacterized protein n=1 Tax=Pseudonocardia hydrocarbonoxydans TaxID=76726 RepID=A0A4Y3WJD6_9PSEU|nr:hypothetical protein PHY01_11280 [Pseudonocardia hydrocarbonoxydans]
MRSRFATGCAPGLVDSVLVDTGSPSNPIGRCVACPGLRAAPFRHRMGGLVVRLTLSFISVDGAYAA